MKIAIVGAGGFAREVQWLIKDINRDRSVLDDGNDFEFAGSIVSDLAHKQDAKVLGDFNWLRDNPIDAVAIGIGNPEVRMRLALQLHEQFPHLKFPALVHPSVRCDEDSCHIGEGSIICAGSILTVNVCVGRFAMVNLSCTLGHECEIGEGTVINPLCAISGGVKIGKRVLVGTHSAIQQNLSIGDDAVIGSGAMVNKDVPAGVTVVGVPAKPR